jgi:hypothetical protein|tara:strand:+ start:9 stop:353 length:345 start_codon:yes stop_codon:yes gene_type:complete
MAKYRPGTANDNVINLFERGKDPEQKLWISVLGKALEDALRGSDLREAEFSINWIASQGSDFRLVCHLAGRNWKYVYETVKHRIAERRKNIEDFRHGKATQLLKEDRNNDLSPM